MEIVIANDGSTDGTRRAIDDRRLPPDLPVHVYHSPINLGKGAAVRLGLAFATGDVLLIQDADLELDPAEYTRLLAPILDGPRRRRLRIALPRADRRVPTKARTANRFLTMLTNVLFGGRLTDMETAYKVMRTRGARGHPSALRRLRHRAGADRAAAARRPPHRGSPDLLQPAHGGRRQEDALDRRRRRDLHPAEVPTYACERTMWWSLRPLRRTKSAPPIASAAVSRARSSVARTLFT